MITFQLNDVFEVYICSQSYRIFRFMYKALSMMYIYFFNSEKKTVQNKIIT